MSLMLYVHIPFCVHKCHYCDFNSHVRSSYPWAEYQQALLDELRHWSMQPQFAGRHIESFFFGGGTPSLAPPSLIEAVIDAAQSLFGMTSDVEISMEANPGTVDAGHFRDYRQAGINRLSIGMQSLDANELRWLERIHSPAEAIAAFETGRAAGFDNINLDLMYGLPAQPITRWQQTLAAAINLTPEHLSCYQLTVEPHTRLAATQNTQPVVLPDDETSLLFFSETRGQLADAGYPAYEVSNFAKPGFYCRHNDGYWLYHDYIGIGAGAAGKWDSASGGVHRYSNSRSPETYMAQVGKHGQAMNGHESLGRRMSASEAVWMGLRRHAGLSRPWFAGRFGSDVMTMFGDELGGWLGSGTLIADEHHVRLSESGVLRADSVAADLF